MTQYEEVIKWQLPRYYEPREGKFIRVMRSSEPVHISSLASTNVSVSGGTSQIICSTTFDSNTEGFLVAYGFSHSAADQGAEMWFADGNSTIVPQRINKSEFQQNQITTIDAPFYRVDAGQTIAAYTDTAGTVCAWATLIKFPIFDYVEPESV
ncbi:MAG: hypothetical protein ACTSUF_03535 [Candidatus Heimdallarchaeaceae archaeon]